MKTSRTSGIGRATVVAAAIGLLLAGALLGALLASRGEEDEAAPIVVGANADQAATSAVEMEADDVPIGDDRLRRIEAAALRITGGGSVTDIDRSDDVGEAFEVEVVTDSGEVDVALDDNLRRVPNVRYELED